MSGEELTRTLLREGAIASRAAWLLAEQAVEEHRLAMEGKKSDLRAAADRRLAADTELLRSELRQVADVRCRKRHLQAEAALGQRLKALASQELERLAADRTNLWHDLFIELPDADWVSVRVHPADHDRARSSLPGAEVATDATLGGGMVVATAGGRVQVDNSLSCRLERVWPGMLPKLLGDLRAPEEEK